MKTIEELAKEYSFNMVDLKDRDKIELAVKHGVGLAQEWYEIDFDKDGFTTEQCNEEIVKNLPVLFKEEDGYMEAFHEITKEIKFKYKFWRPIELK